MGPLYLEQPVLSPALQNARICWDLQPPPGRLSPGVWMSHQPTCNLEVIRFLKEKWHVGFQTHVSTVLALQDLDLTNLSCLGISDLKLLVLTLPHCQNPHTVAFFSFSVPVGIVWQMHLSVRLREGLIEEMTLNGGVKENRSKAVIASC